jgi:fatty acid desaturase
MSGLYSLAIHMPWRTPLPIAAGPVDAWMPFVPAAAYIYATYYVLLPALIVLAGRRRGFVTVYAATMGAGLANVLACILVPTTLSERPDAPSGSLLSVIQALDTPLAALPSGHVVLPCAIAVSAWLVSRTNLEAADRRFWRLMAAVFVAWTLLLAVAALLTKQHVALDVAAGLLVGGTAVLSLMWARRALYLPTLAALAFEWSLIALAIAATLRWWSAPVAAAAILFIASRQHALLVLYHDGVHGLAARRVRVNDFVVNMLVGVPMLLPIHMYRALHLSHHRDLGSASDPERVLLYRGQAWAFRPLPGAALARQLAGDLLAWNGVAMTLRYFRERQSGALKLPRTHAYPELVVQFAVVYGAAAAALAAFPEATVKIAILWFLPYVTVTQLLQKIRSFAEHALEDVEPSRSCSWTPGALGRLTVWPYNINYHREHHAQPAIPWDRLPSAFPPIDRRPGRDLLKHLWSGALR